MDKTEFTSEEAATEAEKAIVLYAAELGLNTPEDACNALEMLISKAARGIEKYCGISKSCEVLHRTLTHMQKTLQTSLKPYIFFRGKAFYVAEYPSDGDAIEGAILNVGTTRVETTDGQLVWEQGRH